MSTLEMRTRPVGEWSMNAFVLICPETRHSVLIDPGAEPETLKELLQGSTPVAILITHSHIDHIGALAEMRAQLQVPVMAHAGPHSRGVDLQEHRLLQHGDTVRVGEHTLRIYHTPGHTADQICIALAEDNRNIVGDTIFEGGPGQTGSSEDFQTTRRTLREVILGWPDETVCYPGHGAAFCLGDRRKDIEAFLRKDHGEFHGDATWEM